MNGNLPSRNLLPVICMLLIATAGAGLAQEQPLRREGHSPEAQLRFAEGLLVRKFYDMAEAEFQHFLLKYPDHDDAPLAMFRLIECQRGQGKDNATLSTINRFQARWPQHDLAAKLYLWKGELLLRQDRLPQAASSFKDLTLSKDSVIREAALYFLAECQTKQGEIEQGLRTYAKIADNVFDTKHLYRPYAVFRIAWANQIKGDFAEAEKGFKRLRDEDNVPPELREEGIYRLAENHFLRLEYKAAIGLYELLLVEYPNGNFAREAAKRRAWAYLAVADFGKAVELCRDWRQRYADAFDYELDYVLGAALVGAGFFGEALELFQTMTADARVPDSHIVMARHRRIYCLLRLERYEDAQQEAAAFHKDYPNAAENADVHFFAGEALFQSGAYDASVDSLRSAIEAAPADWSYAADAHFRLTECLEQAGRPKQAAAVFRKLADEPGREDRAYVLFQAGRCEREAGDLNAAVADFERILKEFPGAEEEFRAAMMHLGELYAELEQYDRAVQLIQDMLAREQAEGRPRLLFFLGYLRFRQEKFADAEEQLRASLAAQDTGKTANSARYFLAGALLETGRDDEALEIFGRLLRLPMAERPQFDADLLLRLEQQYYNRHRYDVSEAICRWLLKGGDEAVIYPASLRLSRILIAQNKLDAAQKFLQKLLDKYRPRPNPNPNATLPTPETESFMEEEISSLLGEVWLLTGDHDRAVHAFETCLARPGLGDEFVARARWGLAELYFRENRDKQSLHHAVNAFVLSNNPVYTPRAMFLAVRILARQGKPDDARTTWDELRQRFPSFAEERHNEPVVQELPETDTGTADNQTP